MRVKPATAFTAAVSGPQLQKALLADALHVHQLFDLLERAILGAVVHDSRGHLCADAGQLLQLGYRRRVQVDRRRRTRCRRFLRLWLVLLCERVGCKANQQPDDGD
jgi:hypothetical protein